MIFCRKEVSPEKGERPRWLEVSISQLPPPLHCKLLKAHVGLIMQLRGLLVSSRASFTNRQEGTKALPDSSAEEHQEPRVLESSEPNLHIVLSVLASITRLGLGHMYDPSEAVFLSFSSQGSGHISQRAVVRIRPDV